MIAFIESLSLGSGAACVALVSAFIAGVVSLACPPLVRWLSVIIIPLAISFCLYWLPLWLGDNGNRSEYSSWEFLVVGVWFLAGMISSVLVTLLVGRYVKTQA